MKINKLIKFWSAWLAIVAAFIGIGFNLWNQFTNDDQVSNINEISNSIILFLLAAILSYVITKFEDIEKELWVLSSSPCSRPSAEVMDSRDEFFEKLLDITLSGKEVYTHMLQDSPDILGGKAEEYFNKVHNELKKKGTALSCFRRIVSLGSKEKALWVLKTLEELKEVDSYSLAVININHEAPLTSVHTCIGTNGSHIILVWASMSPDGTGRAFLFQDKAASKTMCKEHERTFQSCRPLKIGRQIIWDNIEEMVEKYNLKETEEYIKLNKFKLSKYS